VSLRPGDCGHCRPPLEAALRNCDQLRRRHRAETYCGTAADAAIDWVLGRGIRAITLGQATARQAGNLRHRDRLNPCHIVVATAIRLGGGIVATGDLDDLRSLAREHANVKVEPLL
jgi:hypothetical protein